MKENLINLEPLAREGYPVHKCLRDGIRKKNAISIIDQRYMEVTKCLVMSLVSYPLSPLLPNLWLCFAAAN